MGTRFKGGAAEVRALCAYINLMRAADSVAARAHRHLAGARLTMSQFGVLEALLHCGPQCQSALGAKLLRTGASVTAVLDVLERRGLVSRARSEEDRRFVTVALTGKGRALVAGLFPRHAQAVARELAALNVPEQEELRRLCRKLGRGKEEPCQR